MNIASALLINEFIEKKIEPVHFQEWLFSSPENEGLLGVNLYEELILINYLDKDARHEAIELFHNFGVICDVHKYLIIDLLENILQRKLNPITGLNYMHYWANKGYTFFYDSFDVANINEMGRSIFYVKNLDQYSFEELWLILKERDPKIEDMFSRFLKDIKTGQIEFTGKFKKINHQDVYLWKDHTGISLP
jgi:hypothetical protein